MLKAAKADWILLLSTTSAEQRLPQKIYVATSTDGLTWDIREGQLLEDSNRNYLDPSAVETSPRNGSRSSAPPVKKTPWVATHGCGGNTSPVGVRGKSY
jgi:hypothetical protein